MSFRLFQVLLLPFVCLAVVFIASWVRQEGLEFPAGVLASLAVLPVLGWRL